MLKNQTDKKTIIGIVSMIITLLSLILFIGIIIWPVINQTNHTGFEPYYIVIPFSISGLSLYFLSILSIEKNRIMLFGLLISLLGIALLFSYKQFNIMLSYDEWLTRGMPNRFEEISTMFWVTENINNAPEIIYENDQYIYQKDLDLNNAIAFIIIDKNSNQEIHLMSHDGDRFEITQDNKYFIQYRMHITSNTYQNGNFLKVYDLQTAQFINGSTSFDLNLDLSKDPADYEWFSIYIDTIEDGPLNFYNQDDNSITVPVKQCLDGENIKCTSLGPYVLEID